MKKTKAPFVHADVVTDGEPIDKAIDQPESIPESSPHSRSKPLAKSTPHPTRKSTPSSSNLAATTITKKLVPKSTVTKSKINIYDNGATSKQPIDIFEVPDDEESDDGESEDGTFRTGSGENEEKDHIAASSSNGAGMATPQHSTVGDDEGDDVSDCSGSQARSDEEDEEHGISVVSPASSSRTMPTYTDVIHPDRFGGAKQETPVTPRKRKVASPEPESPTPAKRGRGRPRKTPVPTSANRSTPKTRTSTTKTSKIKNSRIVPEIGTRRSPRLHPKEGEALLAAPSPWNLSYGSSTPAIVRTNPTPLGKDGELPGTANRRPPVRHSASLAVPVITKKRKTKRTNLELEAIGPVIEEQEVGEAVLEEEKQRGVEEADVMELAQEQDDDMNVDHDQDVTMGIDQAEAIMDLPPSQVELNQILSTLNDYETELRNTLARSFGPPRAPNRSGEGRVGSKAPVPSRNGNQPYTTLSALAGLQYHDFPAAFQKAIDDILGSVDDEAMRILFARLVGHPSAAIASNNNFKSIIFADEIIDQDNERTPRLKDQTAHGTKTERPYTLAASKPQRQLSILRLNATSSFGPSLFQEDHYRDYMDHGGLDGQTERDYEAVQKELEIVKSTADKSNKSKLVMHNQLRGAFNAIARVIQTNHGLDGVLRPIPTDRARLEKALELLHDQTKTWTEILRVPK